MCKSAELHEEDARDVLKYSGVALVIDKTGLSIKNGCGKCFL